MNSPDNEPSASVITWQDEMSVGVSEFDTHHKRIIALINKLQSSVARDDDGSITRDVLTEVSNYTLYHFFAEEDLMDKYGYPGAEAHKKEHLELTSKTLQLMNDAFRNRINIGGAVLDFLIRWLKQHIMITDKQYSAFFTGKGVS